MFRESEWLKIARDAVEAYKDRTSVMRYKA
jgi:hypothetical protein